GLRFSIFRLPSGPWSVAYWYQCYWRPVTSVTAARENPPVRPDWSWHDRPRPHIASGPSAPDGRDRPGTPSHRAGGGLPGGPRVVDASHCRVDQYVTIEGTR